MDQTINFYKWVNRKVISKLINKNFDENVRIMILYDFDDNFLDIKDNKIRLGVQQINSNQLDSLFAKFHIEFTQIDLVDARMAFKSLENSKIKLLIKYIDTLLIDDGYIIGFCKCDHSNDLDKLLKEFSFHINHKIKLIEFV